MSMKVSEPRAPRRPGVHRAHGHERVDEYAWLRDDERTDPEVLAHLEQENDWFRQCMAPAADLERALYEEMTARLDPDDSSVPVERNGYWYYHRYVTGSEYAIHGRRQASMDAPEEVLLNENDRARGRAFYRLGHLEPSSRHRYLAIAEDIVGRGQYDIRLFDTDRGQFLPEVISNTAPGVAWSACEDYLFYLEKHPETLLAFRVMRHRVGTDPALDVLVYEEQDDRFYNSIWRSRSGTWIMLGHHSTDTTEVQLLPADQPLAPFVPFLPREPGHEYEIDHAGERFFIRSNWQARNFRIMTTESPHSNDRSTWSELIPHRPESMVLEVLAFDDWLVVAEREGGLRRIRCLSLDGKVDRYLQGAEDPCVMWPLENPSTSTTRIRYGYSSMITPFQTWETDLAEGTSRMLKSESVLGGFSSTNYRTERTHCVARDGAKIPVSLVYHRNTERDGQAPGLIYAYGAYGASTDPWFRNSVISLLDRGFVYCIAHVRGGQELGRTWYEQGRRRHKWNTFNDFIDVTRDLQQRRLIDEDRTYAMGGSAGGLLMGVVINESPGLYHGVVAAVPFVDIVTTMLDESIPLTTGEYREWGNPNERDAYDYMLSYSPYDQVKHQDYPHLLVTTGLHDAQVQYWEPAKWVSRLRQRRSNDSLLLLKTNMDAGHGGASGRYQQYREVAEEFTFLLSLAYPAKNGD
jgi:oligopeptidase B